jgi:hypothetical protein
LESTKLVYQRLFLIVLGFFHRKDFFMKKLLTLFLCACFAVSVVGCGGGDAKKADTKKDDTTKKDDKK